MKKGIKLFRTKINCLMILSLAMLLGSCCDHDEPTLSELKICSLLAEDLEGAECEDNMTTLDISSDAITASALVHANEPDTELTFKLFEKINGSEVLVRTKSTRFRDSDEDVDGKCKVWAAVSWTTSNGQNWPEAELRVEVELNSDTPQSISKSFSIR